MTLPPLFPGPPLPGEGRWSVGWRFAPRRLSRWKRGRRSEAVLLGNVAFRTGVKLQWDAENLKATNAPEGEQYIRPEFREGWG